MRVGSVSGKDTVYRVVKVGESQNLIRWEGEILLNAGERLLGTLHGQLILFHRGWSNFGADPRFTSDDGRETVFFDTDGLGTLYITDSRIVFLRRPDLKEVRLHHHGHGGNAYSPIPPLHMAQRVLEANALEYCEIRYSDVVRYKEKRKGLQSFLMVDGQKYLFVISKEAGEILLPIYKKRRWES